MKIQDKAVVITGAGRGIGAALARRLARENPRGMVIADIDSDPAALVADEVRATGVAAMSHRVDVADPSQVLALIAAAEQAYGTPEVVCSNAGIAQGMGLHADAAQWHRAWTVNVMGHISIAQAVMPAMAARREGYLLITASAAGLVGLPGDAPYSVTKHAAVGLAEWLAVTYRRAGIRVGVLCPLGVRTNLLMPGVRAGHPAAREVAALAPIIEPDEVAESALQGIADERFLILPHPQVSQMLATKAANLDRWVAQHARTLQ